MKGKKVRRRPIAEQIAHGLKELDDALSSGKRLPERFTMRTIELQLEPVEWEPGDIKKLREEVFRASQSVFAKLLGVSVDAVQSWEQGGEMSPMARRMLELVERDPTPLRKALESAFKAKSLTTA